MKAAPKVPPRTIRAAVGCTRELQMQPFKDGTADDRPKAKD